MRVFTCRDREKNKIASIGAAAVRDLYVNGRPVKAGYLFSLKTRPQYRRLFFLHKGYEYLKQFQEEKKLPFCLQTILEDNTYAIKLLEKRRPFMPDHHPMGTYEVFAFKTGMDCQKRPGMHFRQCREQDMTAVTAFLNREGKAYQFYPVVKPEDFAAGNPKGLSFFDFYLLEDNHGQILACGAAWNQAAYKQYIIRGYKGFLKYLSPVSALLPVFGYPHMLGKPGTVLNFFTLSFWAVKDHNAEVFESFVRNISRRTDSSRFFVLGVHENNPLKKGLKQLRHFSYKSKIYLVDWDKSGKTLAQLDKNRVPYLECGTL